MLKYKIPQIVTLTPKELLTDPAKSVGDVAYALGYQYPQYFSKAFKRVVGCSPNEYRTLS